MREVLKFLLGLLILAVSLAAIGGVGLVLVIILDHFLPLPITGWVERLCAGYVVVFIVGLLLCAINETAREISEMIWKK
jgi:Mn2+/Fe2+ NRAMP family transporter